MKLFDTLKNIWKIEELKTRILTTLGLILVYRLGTEVVLPGIDPAGLAALNSRLRVVCWDCWICFREVHFRMLRSLPWELCPISLLLS